MSNFKLKAEDWPHSETKLKSARDVNTLKDKFAFFMQRIDKRQSKELKDPISKRESLVSNDSADFSFDKSTSPYKQFQKVSTTNTMRLSLKPKPKFSLFEENLKSSKKSDVSQVLDNDNTKPRETLPHSRSFSLTMPFSFKFRLSLPQIERNISEITSSYKSIVEEIESLKQELQSQKTNLDSITSEEAIILSTIKETRDGRNKLIAEKVMLENEIDFLKNAPINTKAAAADRLSKNSQPIVKHSALEFNMTTANSHPLDVQIDELENKLSLMKLENSKFYENIDMLNDEVVVNEEKNKVSYD